MLNAKSKKKNVLHKELFISVLIKEKVKRKATCFFLCKPLYIFNLGSDQNYYNLLIY